MEPFTNDTPLIVIVGQTASGKSAMALELAGRFNGEIVAADSRTVYKGMDIGTAKPTTDERSIVPHHLIDVVTPNNSFTAADFKHLAIEAITDIGQRGKVPILVGGTGLYIDSLLFDFTFRGPANPLRRQALERCSIEELQELLQQEGLPFPSNERNPRHLIRAIEAGSHRVSAKKPLRPRTLIIGVAIAPEVLQAQIEVRVERMLLAGLEQEVRHLVRDYGWGVTPLQTIGYQEFLPYLEGRMVIEEVRQALILHTRQYAKRQKTWFKRNPAIHWISKTEEAVDLVTTFLNK